MLKKSLSKRIVLKALISASFLAALASCGGGEDQQAKYLERAQEHFENENFDKATVDARNVLQINPKNMVAKTILADISLESGDLRKAFGSYSGILEEEPGNVDANVGLSRIHIAVRDYQKSLEHAEDALAVEPGNTKAQGFKALSLMGLEKNDEAFELAQSTLAVDAGNSAALAVVTQHFASQDSFADALPMLEKGAEANPDEPTITIMKFGVHQALEDKPGMERELISLTERFPEAEQYSTMLAGFYIREGESEKAEATVRRYAEENDTHEAKNRVVVYLLQQESQEKAIAQAKAYIDEDKDTRMINALAEVYLFTGDQEKGIETLYQSVETDSESVGAIEARARLVQIYLQDKNFDQASALIGDILDIESENEVALMARSAIYLSNGEIKEAITDLRTVTKNNPENMEAIRVLSQAQEAIGNRDLALDSYKRMIALGDRDPQTLASAARLAIQADQFEEAEQFIRAALEQQESQDDPSLVTNLVRLLALKEDWTEAESFAQRLVENENSAALGHYLKGAIALQTDRADDSLDHFKASLDAQPEAIESLAAYAAQLSKQSSEAEAVEFVEGHCQAHSFASCHYVLGTFYAQQQNFDAAEQELRKSLDMDDKAVRTYRQLAKVYVYKRDAVNYEATLTDAIESTNSVEMKFDLATFFFGQKKYQQSVDIYEEIIAANPERALAAKNNVSMIYVDYLSSDENQLLAQSYIADLQESDNPAYLDTVGWVSYKLGDYDQAVTYVKAAVDKVGDHPLLRFHLGMAYYKAGDMELAKENLLLATSDIPPERRYDGFDEALATLETI